MSEEKRLELGMCEAHTRGENMGNVPESVGEQASGGESVDQGKLVAERADGESVVREDGKRLQGNRGEQARGRKVRDEVERLAGLIEGSESQLDLLAGADELDDRDVLAVAAESVAAPRRGRGRPKGAANVRNTRVFDYLEALGHRDPLVTLSLIQTADTRALAKLVGMEVGEALRIQLSAAKEMLPYKYAKRPQEFNVNKQRAHIFLTGTLDMAGGEADDGTMSIFGGKTIDNQ